MKSPQYAVHRSSTAWTISGSRASSGCICVDWYSITLNTTTADTEARPDARSGRMPSTHTPAVMPPLGTVAAARVR
ncbi:hypothetical protein DN402_31775 [Streptomyces sp. SW4]|nr:hypothetical protein DN402_31775 [Streptomyces sp. SW4]